MALAKLECQPSKWHDGRKKTRMFLNYQLGQSKKNTPPPISSDFADRAACENIPQDTASKRVYMHPNGDQFPE